MITLDDLRRRYISENNIFRKRFFLKDDSEFKKFIEENIPYSSLQELCFKLKHEITENPRCPICGKEIQFTPSKMHYPKYCSKKCECSPESESTMKRLKTNLEKHGDAFYNNHEKQEQTMLSRHGIKSALCSGEFREKGLETKLERYGDKNFNNPDKATMTSIERHGSGRNKEKIQMTMIERHGVKSYLSSPEVVAMKNSPEIQSKIQQSKRSRRNIQHIISRRACI